MTSPNEAIEIVQTIDKNMEVCFDIFNQCNINIKVLETTTNTTVAKKTVSFNVKFILQFHYEIQITFCLYNFVQYFADNSGWWKY